MVSVTRLLRCAPSAQSSSSRASVSAVDRSSMFSALCLTEFAAKTKQIAMNYINYETAIVERFKVKLIGWTFSWLVSPSEIGTVDDIRTLRNALKTGVCKWICLSKQELAAHVEEGG
jgi:hypothetical protein